MSHPIHHSAFCIQLSVKSHLRDLHITNINIAPNCLSVKVISDRPAPGRYCTHMIKVTYFERHELERHCTQIRLKVRDLHFIDTHAINTGYESLNIFSLDLKCLKKHRATSHPIQSPIRVQPNSQCLHLSTEQVHLLFHSCQ